MTGADIGEIADRLEAQVRSSAVLSDDPLAPVLREAAALARAIAEAINRLEKLGAKRPG